MPEGKLTILDIDTMQRLQDKIDRISVDVAEIRVRVAGLLDHLAQAGQRERENEGRLANLESRFAGLKMVGISLAVLWGIATTAFGLWLRLR